MIYYQAFSVVGEINKTIFDVGIESTEKEPKTLLSVIIQVTGYAGNYLESWIEKAKVMEIPDYCLDTTESTGTTSTQKSAWRLNEIPIGCALGIGERFKVAIRCGGTARNIVGAYVFEITT